jgi:hypothetical protein
VDLGLTRCKSITRNRRRMCNLEALLQHALERAADRK